MSAIHYEADAEGHGPQVVGHEHKVAHVHVSSRVEVLMFVQRCMAPARVCRWAHWIAAAQYARMHAAEGFVSVA